MMIQVVITYKADEFRHYSYVCTPEGAFALWLALRADETINSIVIKSMNGRSCEMNEHNNPTHGMQSLYDLAAYVNVK